MVNIARCRALFVALVVVSRCCSHSTCAIVGHLENVGVNATPPKSRLESQPALPSEAPIQSPFFSFHKRAPRMPVRHRERHRTGHIGWLRAAVLGANDGILSTASLVLGVAAAAHGTRSNVSVAGVAGLVAGAMSMAAGEYVSVRSQADTEQADLEREHAELRADDKGEHRE